ncbi:BEM_HP_G0079020.mRNA.1.CDS.1 [Saccharomyces cerevisiae]|nr:BEM_HP_G0079020.mRNA.1.CDS.1 [Saccharomyces cerevisiae]CAI6990968.1 BEM_HP_G0079020.mRNA.1.CDS.1 [Saccharomyces cerevisiae]
MFQIKEVQWFNYWGETKNSRKGEIKPSSGTNSTECQSPKSQSNAADRDNKKTIYLEHTTKNKVYSRLL